MKEITLRWETGKIETSIENLLQLNATDLKKFVKVATLNRAEVKEELASVLHSIIDDLHPHVEEDKKLKDRYTKLLAIVEDRKSTKSDKIIKKIIDNCEWEELRGVFFDAEKYCIMDNYRILRFNERPSANIGNATRKFDTVKCLGDIEAYTVKLSLPSAAELKKCIKLAKNGYDFERYHVDRFGRSYIVNYDFGFGLPMVNAEYLLDMVEALPNAEAFCMNRISSLIYFKSGENDGILLPRRKVREFEEEPIAEEVKTADVAEKVIEKAEDEQVENVVDIKEEVENVDGDVSEIEPEKKEKTVITAVNPIVIIAIASCIKRAEGKAIAKGSEISKYTNDCLSYVVSVNSQEKPFCELRSQNFPSAIAIDSS